MAERPGKKDAKLRQDTKDESLCEKIVNVLKSDGPQRVLLEGEAGIGKTRLAKKVGEYAVINRFEEPGDEPGEKPSEKAGEKPGKKTGEQKGKKPGERKTSSRYCFLTLCLHLNKIFDDEWSLYENIASQLSVYSDFEETEVDDRDEDEEEEKKEKELLDELKKNIIKEIEKRELAAIKKKEAIDNPKNLPIEKKDDLAEENAKKEATKDRYLLLILDDEGNKTSEYKVMKILELEKFLTDEILKDGKRLKILVTRRKKPKNTVVETDTKETGSHSAEEDEKNDKDTGSDGEITEENVPPTTEEGQIPEHGVKNIPTTGDKLPGATESSNEVDMSKDLLDTIKESTLWDLFYSIASSEWKNDDTLIDDVVKKSKNSPAAIVVLANSLKQITEKESEEKELKVKELKKKIQEILSADRFAPFESRSSSESRGDGEVVPADQSDPSDQGSTAESAVNPILHLAYELLKDSFSSDKTILDCFWHSLDFFKHCGCVYYRDLITQWILEGYFDPVRSVETAYQKGHSILMELINCRMLKIQENNVVVPERAMSNLIDPRRRGLLGRSRLRYSKVYVGDKKKGIGKINQIDDMIKTVQAKKGDKISTLLVSGDRLRRENPKKFFRKLDYLEVLGLFEPTVDPFVTALKELKERSTPKKADEVPVELRVLVIRDCDLLKEIEDLTMFRQLQVLEVSGASSLKMIPHDFFLEMLDLQSLHLSKLQITFSPSSITKLKKLHCLIIKDCPLLEDLPDIQELVELEVVDISGARGLKTCFDNTAGDQKNKSKNKNFYHLTKLQHLDFSESQIERLPIFQDSAKPEKLKLLTRLLLRNCSKLRRLPSLKPLSGLQILDLSGTTSLVEMLEVCFEDKKELKTLNLTGTNLNELATTIEELSNLNELLLKGCANLKEIPNIEKLTNLEIIDVSGCTELATIKGSFQEMFYLREVNLFDTKVTITPDFLPKESKINISCRKRFIQADGRSFEGDKWSDVKDAMRQMEIPDKASSSGEVVESQKIVEKVAEEKREIQPSESHARDCTMKGAVSKERLHKVPITTEVYKNILSRLDTASRLEVEKVHESKDLVGEAQANADSVSLVDISSTRLTSIFNDTKTVKSCSLWMCMDIKDLFSGVDEEGLGSLETLSITNLPELETICWGNSCKNLKKLSIECCPNIKTIFPEASQLPSSLEDLHIKYCEKLEKVVEGVELSTLTTLTWTVKNCPKFKGNPQGLGFVMVDGSEITPQG